METVLAATQRLRDAGFTVDFAATATGQLRCSACGFEHDPETLRVDEVVRYEGVSDPSDETILLALRSDRGCCGVYTAAFGSDTSEADVAALHRLPRGSDRVGRV